MKKHKQLDGNSTGFLWYAIDYTFSEMFRNQISLYPYNLLHTMTWKILGSTLKKLEDVAIYDAQKHDEET